MHVPRYNQYICLDIIKCALTHCKLVHFKHKKMKFSLAVIFTIQCWFNLQKVKALHVEDMDVVVDPGIGWMELNEYLEPYGLFFPLDPG